MSAPVNLLAAVQRARALRVAAKADALRAALLDRLVTETPRLALTPRQLQAYRALRDKEGWFASADNPRLREPFHLPSPRLIPPGADRAGVSPGRPPDPHSARDGGAAQAPSFLPGAAGLAGAVAGPVAAVPADLSHAPSLRDSGSKLPRRRPRRHGVKQGDFTS